jgi:ATP-dependent DNA helicase RecG
MTGSPWQRAVTAIQQALALEDEGGLAAARETALELAVPRELKDALERASTGQLAELLPDWLSDEFAERALARPAEALPGVGPKRGEQLRARGLGSVGELLFHLPTGYDDRRSLEVIGELDVGRHASFVAEIRKSELSTTRMRGRLRQLLEVEVADATGTLVLKWFRASERMAESLSVGARVLVTGDVRRYRFRKEIVHPELEVIDRGARKQEPDSDVLDAQRRIVAEYACPEGIAPRTLRRWIEAAVADCSDLVPEYWPEADARALELPRPAEALQRVHAPGPRDRVEDYRQFASAAHQRLVLEELLLLELGLALRHARRDRLAGTAIELAHSKGCEDGLPFVLTGAQRRALDEIRRDLSRPHPMSRLLQGDVGSGKTAVAYLAAVAATAAGYQVAYMAPTELLAEQHVRTIEALGAALPERLRPRTALLSASLPRAEADAIRAALAAGELDLVIGTHALVQDGVELPRLALAIIDEQHRFGVQQRAALAERSGLDEAPHVLVMTATPIPRTLALTLYGDLDLSVIDALPPGRSPTQTLLAREGEGQQVADRVRETLERGEQVYVVYPLVEESEKIDLRSAVESAGRIARAYPDVHVDLVHGRLEAAERAAAMRRFALGETRILVSTTVIEVGVDVANATLMVVEHAERFGLAQLHQLRGRVGRGERPGTCVLVARGGGEDSEARLRAMLRTSDGFEIADADLRIRGPGEFLGTRQSGHLPDLRVADLLRDARWIARARETAFELVAADPELERSPGLRRAVELRWGERLSLVDVG